MKKKLFYRASIIILLFSVALNMLLSFHIVSLYKASEKESVATNLQLKQLFSKNDVLKEQIDAKTNTILTLNDKLEINSETLSELQSFNEDFMNYYESDIRDDYIIYNDSDIIDLSESPYEVQKKFSCDIDIVDDQEWDNVKLKFDGLTIIYRVMQINNKTYDFMMGYEITSDTFKTEKGLTVNTTSSNVKKIYPYYYSQTKNEWTTYYNNSELGHRFIFDENNILKKICFGNVDWE